MCEQGIHPLDPRHPLNRFVYEFRGQSDFADCVPAAFEYLTGVSRDEVWRFVATERQGRGPVTMDELLDALRSIHLTPALVRLATFEADSEDVTGWQVVSEHEMLQQLTSYPSLGLVVRQMPDGSRYHMVLFAGRRPDGRLIIMDPSFGRASECAAALVFRQIEIVAFQEELRNRCDVYRAGQGSAPSAN